jgi:hypothetical protein
MFFFFFFFFFFFLEVIRVFEFLIIFRGIFVFLQKGVNCHFLIVWERGKVGGGHCFK